MCFTPVIILPSFCCLLSVDYDKQKSFHERVPMLLNFYLFAFQQAVAKNFESGGYKVMRATIGTS